MPRFFPFRIPPSFPQIDTFMPSPSGPGEIFPEDVNSLRKAAQTSTSTASPPAIEFEVLLHKLLNVFHVFFQMWKAKKLLPLSCRMSSQEFGLNYRYLGSMVFFCCFQ